MARRTRAALAVALLASACVDEHVLPAPRPPAGEAEPPLDASGRCVRTCSTPADCCSTPLCTGVGYACNEGLCADEACDDDGDCAAEGEIVERECRVVGGRAGCYVPCAVDEECAGVLPAFEDLFCVGVADDGSRYCDAAEPPPECGASAEPWNECPGWRDFATACRDGECECRADAECADAHVCSPRAVAAR